MPAKRCPGARGGATGAGTCHATAASIPTIARADARRQARGPSTAKRTGRAIAAALSLGDFSAWDAASLVLRVRLTAAQRAALAWAALRTLDPDHRAMVAATFSAGAPLVPLDLEDVASMAGTWATAASEPERAAYALAAVRSMCPADQRTFTAHIARMVTP